MTDTPQQLAQVGNPYGRRPWLALYGDRPASIGLEDPTMLALARRYLGGHPGAPAIRFFGGSLTRAELDRASDALAAALAGPLQVRRSDRVAVVLQNIPQFVIAALAIWKAGAIMVPANPMLKTRELAGLLADAGPSVLITQEDLHAQAGGPAAAQAGVATVITTSPLDVAGDPPPGVLAGLERVRAPGTLDLLELLDRHAGQRPPALGVAPDDVAALLYTSGTTGPPKGAMLLHRNLAFTSTAYRAWLGLDEHDSVLALAPLFHVTGLVAHLGAALAAGMPLVLGHRFDAASTLELVERHRPTFTIAAITAFTALMSHPGFPAADLSSLTTVLTGGAPVAPAIVERWRAATGVYIHNAYGLTEVASPSHIVPFGTDAPVDPASGALSVGVPIFDTLVEVLDDAGEPVPVGELGQFVTSGPGVVPGYWGRPEETRHALGDGRLRTGDIGFMDERGWFYVVDRSKDMIVASGFKVWPREVEDVLYEHPAVREAAVVGVPDAYRGETVRAFVALEPGRRADPGELVAFCRERLAAYKYPREVTVLDELPKTPTGKILRRELRDRLPGEPS